MGSRMGTQTPKQFLLLQDVPVIIRTIRQFLNFDKNIHLIVVLPKDHINIWEAMRKQYLAEEKIDTVIGGETRYQSVANGLKQVSGGLVAIHDAVRPLIKEEIIAKSFEVAYEKGSAVVSVPLKDSIRMVDESGSRSLDRSAYQLVQTPQVFQVKYLKKAFEPGERSDFTDDASVFEAAGYHINLVMGDYSNIKLTTKEDLVIASALLKQKTPNN